jgi:uncharacterized phage-associated protein
MLNLAQALSIALDHFALQKLLYFAHGLSLRGVQGLISGGSVRKTAGGRGSLL